MNTLKTKTLICIICNNTFTIPKSIRRKTCSDKCKHSISDETKNKLRIKRNEYLKNNPDKHCWKYNSKFKSAPCEYLKNILKDKNINFVEEYSPIQNRRFSLDIAFPDIKVCIEVNGNQHYNSDKTLKPYYQSRHDIISSHGWLIHEIHYSKVYNKQFVDDLLNNLHTTNINYDFYIKKDKNQFVGAPKPNKKQLYDSEKLMLISKLKESDIDFSKFGWVKHASKILEVKPQKVNHLLKRLDSDFLATCFSRK